MNAAELTPPTPIVPRKRRRWVSIALSLVIFLSGFLVGGAAALVAVRKHVRAAVQHPETLPGTVAQVLRRRLSLDERQTAKVEEILRTRHTDLRRAMYPRVAAAIESAREEITAELTPAQKERWTEVFRDWRENWLPPPPEAITPPTSQSKAAD